MLVLTTDARRWLLAGCAGLCGPSPKPGCVNAGVGGVKGISSVSAIDTGWYACESRLFMRPTVDIVFMGIGSERPGCFRARARPRLRRIHQTPPPMRPNSRRVLRAISARIAGRKFATVLRLSARWSETVTDVLLSPPDAFAVTLAEL